MIHALVYIGYGLLMYALGGFTLGMYISSGSEVVAVFMTIFSVWLFVPSTIRPVHFDVHLSTITKERES